MTRRYTNKRLPLPYLLVVKAAVCIVRENTQEGLSVIWLGCKELLACIDIH